METPAVLPPLADAHFVIDTVGSQVTLNSNFINGGSGPVASISVGATGASELIVAGGTTLESTGNVTVGSNGTLSGSGTVLGNVDVQGGTLAAGSSIGSLTLTGNLDLQGGSTVAVDLSGSGTPVAGTHNDTLIVSGTLALTGNSDIELLWLPGTAGDGKFGGDYQVVSYASQSGAGGFSTPSLAGDNNGTPVSATPNYVSGASVNATDVVVTLVDLLVGDANIDGDVDVFQFPDQGDAQIVTSNLGTDVRRKLV